MRHFISGYHFYLVFRNVGTHIESSISSFVILTMNLQPATLRTHCWKTFGTKKTEKKIEKKMSEKNF